MGLIGNLGQELGSLDDALAARIGDVLDSWAAHMEACLKEAVESGEISCTLDPKLLSQFFWASWEGAVLRSKALFLDAKDGMKVVLDPLTQPLSWILQAVLELAQSTPWWLMISLICLFV